MCGRFGLWAEPEQVVDYYQLYQPVSFTPRYNIAPSQDVLTVGQVREGLRKAAMLHWGLIPHWAQGPKLGYKMINARAETLFSKPAYKSAAAKRRCLIPANCFFEWKRGKQGQKQPYCIRPRHSQLFSLAALWEHWRDREAGYAVSSCTIVTTSSNEAVGELHNRMPVIIEAKDVDLWLDRQVQDPERIQALLQPISSRDVEIYAVGMEVNNPDNDFAEVLRPV